MLSIPVRATLYKEGLFMKHTTKIIQKWFDILSLPEEWKHEVIKSAEEFDIEKVDNMSEPYQYLYTQEDKMQGLLYALYKCEDYFEMSKKRNIPDDILLASLSELKRYALEYYNTSKCKKIGLLQIRWLGKILRGNIYRLGRLEFEIKFAELDWEKNNIKIGDKILGVHIPDNGGPFNETTCQEAYDLAEDFFAKYFPEHDYKCYDCRSWLLDKTLRNFLSPSSNIIKFMDTFDIVWEKEAYSALTYLFGMGTEVCDLKNITPKTSLQKHVIDHILNGGKLYSGQGYRAR